MINRTVSAFLLFGAASLAACSTSSDASPPAETKAAPAKKRVAEAKPAGSKAASAAAPCNGSVKMTDSCVNGAIVFADAWATSLAQNKPAGLGTDSMFVALHGLVDAGTACNKRYVDGVKVTSDADRKALATCFAKPLAKLSWSLWEKEVSQNAGVFSSRNVLSAAAEKAWTAATKGTFIVHGHLESACQGTLTLALAPAGDSWRVAAAVVGFSSEICED